MVMRISEYMPAPAALLHVRICPRALALMLLGFGAAGCSADPNSFSDGSYRRRSEATGSLQPDRQSVAQDLRPPMPLLQSLSPVLPALRLPPPAPMSAMAGVMPAWVMPAWVMLQRRRLVRAGRGLRRGESRSSYRANTQLHSPRLQSPSHLRPSRSRMDVSPASSRRRSARMRSPRARSRSDGRLPHNRRKPLPHHRLRSMPRRPSDR